MKQTKVLKAMIVVLSLAFGLALCGIDYEKRMANSEAIAYEATIEEMAEQAKLGEAIQNYILDVILESDWPDNLTFEQWETWDSLATRPSDEWELWIISEYNK